MILDKLQSLSKKELIHSNNFILVFYQSRIQTHSQRKILKLKCIIQSIRNLQTIGVNSFSHQNKRTKLMKYYLKFLRIHFRRQRLV
jgi:hypothetical protein